MVWKNGQKVYENYYQGFTEENTIHVASITKSMVSILVGIAVEQGSMNLDQKVLDFFPEYAVAKGNRTLPQITVRDVMTMTAPYRCKTEPFQKVLSGTGWVTAALDIMGGNGKIGEFHYSPLIGIHVLAGILTKAVGQSLHTFAEERLFSPMGIQVKNDIRLKSEEDNLAFLKARDVSGWVADPEGINTTGWGLTLKLTDMVKIGELYRNQGLWNGQQLVPAEWIAESTRKQSDCNQLKLSYGYLWWVLDEKKHIYAAMGDGGNIIYVNEEKGLVIAIACTYMPQAKDRIALIQKYVEPAFAE